MVVGNSSCLRGGRIGFLCSSHRLDLIVAIARLKWWECMLRNVDSKPEGAHNLDLL